VTNDGLLPKGRLGRLARLAAVGARTGAGLLSQRGEGAAEYAAEMLGTMRGLAAKIGQTLSYVDGLLPEGQRESYETALRALRAKAPQSPWSVVRKLVESELGAPIAELFAELEPEPFASASIGQVHRGRLHDGRSVAVKLQHPGIAEAVESDLNNARVMENLASMLGPRGLDPKAAFAELALRFREELDYGLEAQRQMEFARLHSGDPKIRIPLVIAELSRKRVLTSELATGDTLELAAERPEEERRSYAETLWRFVFKGNLVAGMFNADPHPGNYLFGADGCVTFLDFGCVQPLDPSRLPFARAVHRAALERDEAAFASAVSELLGLRGGEYGKLAVGYSRHCFAPLFESPFHLTRSYSASLVERIQQLKKAIWTKDGSFVMLPPSMLLLNRLQFGFYSVLARLDVRADYAAVERRFLGEAGLLPETPNLQSVAHSG
jgi:predicted unusual protein kinase regulating ubiquinone biosynthesis (AarF/ABC1/UbiB family)